MGRTKMWLAMLALKLRGVTTLEEYSWERPSEAELLEAQIAPTDAAADAATILPSQAKAYLVARNQKIQDRPPAMLPSEAETRLHEAFEEVVQSRVLQDTPISIVAAINAATRHVEGHWQAGRSDVPAMTTGRGYDSATLAMVMARGNLRDALVEHMGPESSDL